jgi:hypothetical protein
VATRLGSVAGRETKRVTSAKTYSGNRGRNADIETVVARLADADLQLPVCQSTSMALLALVATLGLNWPTAKCVRATAETFHAGADAVSFLWPLTAVSQILLAATSPNSDSVRRVFDFFDEMAGLAMLFNPKRRLPDCIVESAVLDACYCRDEASAVARQETAPFFRRRTLDGIRGLLVERRNSSRGFERVYVQKHRQDVSVLLPALP